MSLASHAFILLVLPMALVLYYGLFRTSRRKMFFLLFVSAIFYSLAGWQFVPLLFGLSLCTYWFGRRGWVSAGLLINLAALLLFKYWNFGVANFNLLMGMTHLNVVANVLSLGLPLGISFYVFKHIGYLLDLRSRRYPASDDPWAFLTFSAYFPQIGAGPISNYEDTAGQFYSLPGRLESGQATTGLVYLSFGLAKKVLIANQIGLLFASQGSSVTGFSGFVPSWYAVIAFAVQLYFDFSGYTDMALGVSALFGIRLPPNFNSPYLARNPAEFWDRWHISLSTWFRYYLFSPLSRSLLKKWGSGHREAAQYSANLLTMSLIGLWHGASWGYILWGAYHGALLSLNAWWKRTGRSIPKWISRPAFLAAILLGWALFMSPDFASLRHLLASLIGRHGFGGPAQLDLLWHANATLALLIGIPLAFSGYSEAAQLLLAERGRTRIQIIAWGILAAISLVLLESQISFFYVQF